MKKLTLSLALSLLGALMAPLFAAAETNPAALTALLNRIGGEGTADRFTIVVDDALETRSGKDVFVLSSDGSKPKISGNSALAAATGINWYLNHYAHVNLAWNQLTTDLTSISLPTPTTDETRTCEADYRYYLNYCTFSYSMCTWTWERWQQEIDWMALHGINMPLQIIGLDVLWYNLLTKDLGYSKDEANKFIAGPSFQAWWGMNNLEGWGGPNPDWWYTRQEQLCKNILARMRELDMDPVLPGYAGMVPSNIGEKGYTALNQGNWCNYVRPYILDPNSQAFATVSEKYYARLEELMGTSPYYSLDPFHEGANTAGIDVPAAYDKLYGAMEKAVPGSKWVIQFWQWHSPQYNVLNKVPQGRLIVLDLFSDNQPNFGSYKVNGQEGVMHDAVWCSLANFGGRTGLFGRFNKVIDRYYADKATYSHIKGIGATPEAIEQVPVLYDALFELPWRSTKPDAAEWMANYTVSRYGVENEMAKAAWEKLRTSALDCTGGLQGPHEAVVCGRPALSVGAVSAWGGTGIFYDIQQTVDAAHLLKAAGLSGENYSYDLTDVTRQALTDYAYYLLAAINSANGAKDTEAFTRTRDHYLQLILDLDELLNTNRMFMLGHWTQTARGIADEVPGTTTADKDWLELNNARTIISTWGDRDQANGGGLRDYSYREWGGMMKDYYYPRWKYFFDNNLNGADWFAMERAWALDKTKTYSDVPVGSTADVAGRLLPKYFTTFKLADGSTRYLYRYFEQDSRSVLTYSAFRDQAFTMDVALPAGVTATLSVDTDNDGTFAETETVEGLSFAVPATAVTGRVKARMALSDGSAVSFSLILKDDITTPRTVSVVSVNTAEGTAAIVGASGASVTNVNPVEMKATPASGFEFVEWVDANGNLVSKENPYTYYGKDAATFTAKFLVNKWGMPVENLRDMGDVKGYEQYVTIMNAAWNGGDPVSIYSATECPATLCHTTDVVEVPRGGKFTLTWKDTETANGLGFCRLSAYVDVNSDGDFDDEGEFIAVVGNTNTGGNTMLSDGTLDVLLPYEAPLGITRVRLRFDGSYSGGWDGPNGAKPANAETVRMVYDVPVNVVAYSETACQITAAASSVAGGTVDTNGNTNPYTWSDPNEFAILRAYPADGYILKGWTDQYGRYVPDSWKDENNIKFHPAESGTFTAQFVKAMPETVSISGWEFKYEEKDGNITLLEVVSAAENGRLTIPATWKYEGTTYNIVTLAAACLKNCPELTSLNLPKSVTTLGEEGVAVKNELSWTGGSSAQSFTLDAPMKKSEDWTFMAHFTTGGSSFNAWGSSLVATGTDPFGNFANGFQFYLKADGNLVAKICSVSETSFSKPESEFDLKIQHKAGNSLLVTLTNASGKTETKTITSISGLQDITNLCSAVATGTSVSDVACLLGTPQAHTGEWVGASDYLSHEVPFTLASTEAWMLKLHVEKDASSFNTWGSSPLATGDNPLANDYSDGFQYYLSSGGGFKVKMDGGSETNFSLSPGSSFDVELGHTPGAGVTMTLIAADGQTETKSFEGATFSNHDKFSSASPAGWKTSLTVIRTGGVPFAGCTNLATLTVNSSNPTYAASGNALYNKAKTSLLRVPEGVNSSVTLPATCKFVADLALMNVQGMERLVATKATNLKELPATVFVGSDAVVQATPEQCAAYADTWEAPILVSAAAGATVDATQVTKADILEVCANATATGVFTADNTTAERWFTYTFSGTKGVAVALPAAAKLPFAPAAGFKAYTFSDGAFAEVDMSAWTNVPAGNYVLLPVEGGEAAGKAVTFKMNAAAPSATSAAFAGNATMVAATPANAYAFDATSSLFAPAAQVNPYMAYRVDAAGKALLPFLVGNVTFDETAEALEIPSNTFADVTVKRTLGAGKWNTLCLPFSLSETETAAVFSHVEALTSVSTDADDNFVLNFTKTAAIEAGKPYLVLVNADVDEFAVSEVFFGAATELQPVEQGDVVMKGNWTPMRLENGEYFISDNTFYRSTLENWANLKGFRAYIELSGISEVRQLGIRIDGVLTGLDEIEDGAGLLPVSVYNLSGVLLRQGVPAREALKGLPAGVYMVNGKKVIK